MVYVDASVVLRRVLSQPGAIADGGVLDPGVASELVSLECLRTLDRLRLSGVLPDEHLAMARRGVLRTMATMTVLRVDSVVLDLAARALPTPLRTLDAIHLATALTLRDGEDPDLVLATHDRALGSAARAFGLEVIGLS